MRFLLANAFGQKGLADELKEPLTTIGDARARIYAERNKYAGESAPAAPPAPPAPPVAGGGPARGPAATDTKAAGTTASNAPALALKNAALSATFSNALKQAIDKKAYKAGAIVSGSFGRDAFDDLASDGGVLIGLRCGMGKFANKDVIVSVQPVFLTSKGVVMGTLHGNPNASPVIDLVARDGYVVGGAKIGGTPSPEGLSLRFVRLTDGRLNTSDSYESETIGKLDAPDATKQHDAGDRYFGQGQYFEQPGIRTCELEHAGAQATERDARGEGAGGAAGGGICGRGEGCGGEEDV